MPPQLALFLCTVFVLVLLWLERKQTPKVSLALWIPTIWMLLIASKPLGIWFGLEGGGSTESGSPLDRFFLSVLLCLSLLILVKRHFNWSSVVKKHTWLMLLIGYMFISILWSDIPYISFKRWIREFQALTMAFMILTEPSPRQAFESLLRRSIYILIPFSVLLVKYFPHYGVCYDRWSGALMWIGVAMQKNGLSRLCLIATFYLVWLLVRRLRKRDIPVFKYQTHADVLVLIMTLWLLKGPPGSYSATSITALAAGLAAFVSLSWIKKSRMNFAANTLSVIIAFIICFGIVTPMVGGSTMKAFTSSLGRDETLTGRADIWAGLIPIAMRNPILGSGIGGFWTTATIEAHNGANQAHNGWLEVLLHFGFVGILLFAMFLLSCCKQAKKALSHDFDWASLWICYLLVTVFHNIMEASINSFASHLTAVLVFFLVSSTVVSSYTPGVAREV